MSRKMSLISLSLLMLVSTVAMADDGDAALFKACPGVAAWATDHPHSSEKAAQDQETEHVSDPALRSELARRSTNDQRVRKAMIAAGSGARAAGKEAAAVDSDNLRWLKAVVDKQGFPTMAQVGKSGFHDAWLLVQHADSDPAFQTAVLEQLKPLLANNGVPRPQFALLTDRVLRHQGKPQRYGSQFMPGKDGSFVLEPTQDMAHVEQRRAAMGLMPLPAYKCILGFTYAPPAGAASR